MEDIKAQLTGGGKTVAQLVEATGKSESSVRKTLKSLVEAGAVTKTGTEYSIAATPDTVEGEKRGRGRPKDPFVTARDEQVFDLVKAAGKEGLTVAAIAEKIEVKDTVAYLSVWRLRQAKRVEKVLNGTRQPAWAVAV